MKKLLGLRLVWLFVVFVVIDTLCIGMGMGVPFFCILLGFIVGWFVVQYITDKTRDTQQIFSTVLKYCLVTAGFSFLAMLALWGPFTSYLFDPSKDVANSGIPLILFQPVPSFIGWIVLMVFISPFLQLLTSLFSAYISLLAWMRKMVNAQKAV